MRQNFIQNCQTISPKKDLDDSFDLESVYERGSAQKKFEHAPKTIRLGEFKA